jgi:hypothetical protein
MVMFFTSKRKEKTTSEASSDNQSEPENLPKYFFQYQGNLEAVIFKRTQEWGNQEVGRFKYGKDAMEYVDFKNSQ